MADKDHADETKEEGADHEGSNAKVRKDHKPNVCRKLDFGGDPDQQIVDLLSLSNEDLERHRQKGIEKWNFDFENEIPLEGDWQWEKVPVQPTETKEVVFTMEKSQRENRNV